MRNRNFTVIKRILKREILLALTVALLLLLLQGLPFSMTVSAYTTNKELNLSDSNIGATWTGFDDASWSSDGTAISCSAKSTKLFFQTDYNSTLTLKNNRTEAAQLSFDYTVVLSTGTVKVAGVPVPADDSYNYSGELAAGGSIEIYLKSGSTSTETTITISNLSLVVEKEITTTFQPAEGGSYTVNGDTVTEQKKIMQNSTVGYLLVAKPDSGYKFVGWYSETDNKYLSAETSVTLYFENAQTVTAVFTLKSVPVFDVGGAKFTDLNEANTYATENGNIQITLVSDGTLPTGTYTISNKNILLIPFDSAATLYKDVPVPTSSGSATKKENAYLTLTLAEGAVLNIEGELSVGGTYYAAGGGSSGCMTGTYGLLNLSEGSSVNVKNGGSLYAWGYVVGTGTVTAESGGTVWEWFQIGDFRGGNATTEITLSLYKKDKIFPISQYFIQNIEAPLTVQAGAKEKVYTGVYMTVVGIGSIYETSVEFIGDSGMFKLNSGSISRTYDGSTDRVTYTVSGEMELNSLSLDLTIMNVNSADYVLPLTNNISVNVASGKATINQDLSLLAGVQLTIAEGAEVTVADGKSVYVYDAEEWNAASYTCMGKFVSVPFAYGRTYTRTEADLVDAKIDVNGTMTAAGYIYTTAGGANICSSGGTGRYIQQAAPGTETETYQYTQSGSTVTKATIPVTAAQLRNGNNTFTETATASAGDTYVYNSSKEKWCKLFEVTDSNELYFLYTNIYYDLTFKVSTGYTDEIKVLGDGEAQCAVGSGGQYYLVRKILSNELPDDIKFVLYYEDNGISYCSDPMTASFEKYAKEKIGNTENEELINLLNATITYGRWAKAYFDGEDSSTLELQSVPVGLDKFKEVEINSDATPSSSNSEVSISGEGANFIFDDYIALMYQFTLNINDADKSRITQIGLLRQEVDQIPTTDSYENAYLLYSKTPVIDKVGDPVSVSNVLPTDLEDMWIGFLLKGEEYSKQFALRAFAVIDTDGDGEGDSVIYGRTVIYGLKNYIARISSSSSCSSSFKNFLYATWAYADAATEYIASSPTEEEAGS